MVDAGDFKIKTRICRAVNKLTSPGKIVVKIHSNIMHPQRIA